MLLYVDLGKSPNRGWVINARTLQAADRGTPLEVPVPVLFNTWKHHAGALRVRIRETALLL